MELGIPSLLLPALLLAACEDPNGPWCEGTDDCVAWRPLEEAPCFGNTTVPRYSRYKHTATQLSADWLDESGYCYSVSSDGLDLPEGYMFAPGNHWCTVSTEYITMDMRDEECLAWYDDWHADNPDFRPDDWDTEF